MKSFRDFHLRPELLQALDEAGYTLPTPIQSQAIPIALRGADLMGVAQTGTGKTLAFLLPILHRLEPGAPDPQAIVVCPTRELAIQVAGEAERFARHTGVRTVLAYGGTSSGSQKQDLVRGCDIVVATPGRLLDFIQSAWLSTRRLRWVVLDEADRMLDMGFINDVDAILRRAPMSRQTLLFSATIPEEVRRLAERYMFHPEVVRVDPGTQVTETVEHAAYPVPREQKLDLLLRLLQAERPSKVLIFTATREGTSELARRLRVGGHEVVSLSSVLSQANRERALEAFRKGEFDVLVATDVAARGLDITDIDLVVNFDVPMHPQDYVHRIGRTGRARRAGRAVTLVSERDRRRVADIERLLGEPLARVRVEGFPYRDESTERGRPAARRRPRGAGTGTGAPPAGGVSEGSAEGAAARTGRRRRRRRGTRVGTG